MPFVRRAEARAPGQPKAGSLPLEEARDVLALGVVVLDEEGQVRHDLALDGRRGRQVRGFWKSSSKTNTSGMIGLAISAWAE